MNKESRITNNRRSMRTYMQVRVTSVHNDDRIEDTPNISYLLTNGL